MSDHRTAQHLLIFGDKPNKWVRRVAGPAYEIEQACRCSEWQL